MAATYLQQDTRTYGDAQLGVEHSASHNVMWWYTHHDTLVMWLRVSTLCYGEVWRCIRGKLRCNKCESFKGVRKDDELLQYIALYRLASHDDIWQRMTTYNALSRNVVICNQICYHWLQCVANSDGTLLVKDVCKYLTNIKHDMYCEAF